MQQVQQLLAVLLGRWTMSFAGAGIACMLVWYLGPLVPGGSQPLPRAVLIAVIILVWAGVNAVISWYRRRRERALAAGVTDGATTLGTQAGAEARSDAAEEVARLRQRMQAALQRLRGNRRRGYLYEQPWFVLIGPPGSGKTTALLNSGLHFPLAQDDSDPLHDPSVGGVGGTRLCDWWFADEAVLIDTAGRYTTQDSDAAVDRAGWFGFLDLLRRTRPRQPINGVIVVISLADIAAAEPAERAAHARTVRRRVNEISDRLRLRVPVYMVFSKADRLTGFNEYFDDLDADARSQVWGMTFPLSRGIEVFETEYRLLLDRLNERLFERLQAERAPDRRHLLSGFPLQIASLAEPLASFLTQAFGGTRLDPAPFLRGVYLSSATQEGTPIDQLTGMLARAFGVDQKRAPSLRPVAGRSYFLRRLVTEVVLGEALLVSTNSARQRRRFWLRSAGFAAVGLATVLGAAALWRIEAANRSAVMQATTALADYRSRLAGMTLDPVSDDDLVKIAPLLDAAAALPPGQGKAEASWLTEIPGLSQSGKLTQSDRLIDRNALQQILLPRLVWRLEAQMRARFDDANFLYEATRVYLMLGGAGPLDRTLVRNWEVLDWRDRFPGALNQALRDHLARHLDALLSEPLPAVTLDGGLVSAARATFSRVPLAERVYSRIKEDAPADHVPDWTPAEALGPQAAVLFTRPSGKALNEGIPGFYTGEGFHRILLGHLATTARDVAGESWVLGRTEEIPTDGPAVSAASLCAVVAAIAAAGPAGRHRPRTDPAVAHPAGGRLTKWWLADGGIAGWWFADRCLADWCLADWQLADGGGGRFGSAPRRGYRRSGPGEGSIRAVRERRRGAALRRSAGAGGKRPGHAAAQRGAATGQRAADRTGPDGTRTGRAGWSRRGQRVRCPAGRRRPGGAAAGRGAAAEPADVDLAAPDRRKRPQHPERQRTAGRGGGIFRQRRPGRSVPVRGERALSVQSGIRQRHAARRFCPAVRAQRRPRRVLPGADPALGGHERQRLARAIHRRRGTAGRCRDGHALPARRGDPRRLLPDRRHRTAAAIHRCTGFARFREQAGNADAGWNHDCRQRP